MVFECLLSESLLCTAVAVAAFAFVAGVRWPTGPKRTAAKTCKHRTDAKTKTHKHIKQMQEKNAFTREMLQPQKRSTGKIYWATMESDRNMLQILKTPKTTVRAMLLLQCTKWRHTRLLGGADLFANLYVIIEEGRSCVARNPWHKH